jgi:hypothetical protein
VATNFKNNIFAPLLVFIDIKVPGRILDLLSYFLSKRKFKDSVEGVKSKPREIKTEVLKGPVLFPAC